MNGRSPSDMTAAVRRRRRAVLFYPAVLLAASTVLGCGGDKGPVLVEAGGMVKYKGEPVPDATVVFVPDAGGQPVSALTDDEGRFTVATRGQPGAAPGSYKVAITAIRLKGPVSVNMTTEEILANEEELIPRMYGHPKTSGLTATVSEDPSQNQCDFDLQ